MNQSKDEFWAFYFQQCIQICICSCLYALAIMTFWALLVRFYCAYIVCIAGIIIVSKWNLNLIKSCMMGTQRWQRKTQHRLHLYTCHSIHMWIFEIFMMNSGNCSSHNGATSRRCDGKFSVGNRYAILCIHRYLWWILLTHTYILRVELNDKEHLIAIILTCQHIYEFLKRTVKHKVYVSYSSLQCLSNAL